MGIPPPLCASTVGFLLKVALKYSQKHIQIFSHTLFCGGADFSSNGKQSLVRPNLWFQSELSSDDLPLMKLAYLYRYIFENAWYATLSIKYNCFECIAEIF